MVLRSRLTSKGQITIPQHVRRRLALEPGDDVVFEVTSAGILLRRAASETSRFEKYRGCLSDLRGVDPDGLVDEMRGQ